MLSLFLHQNADVLDPGSLDSGNLSDQTIGRNAGSVWRECLIRERRSSGWL